MSFELKAESLGLDFVSSVLNELDFSPPCHRSVCEADATMAGHWISKCDHAGTYLYCEPCSVAKKKEFNRKVAINGVSHCTECLDSRIITEWISFTVEAL